MLIQYLHNSKEIVKKHTNRYAYCVNEELPVIAVYCIAFLHAIYRLNIVTIRTCIFRLEAKMKKMYRKFVLQGEYIMHLFVSMYVRTYATKYFPH